MKKFNRFSKIVLATFIYTAASLQSVVGDDTEIFFAPADDVDGVYPNIMFIIDSSGSMGWGVDGTTDSRMEVVQDVMDEVLTEITNVNAGLMRFNNGKPGPVLYPVLNIDKEATPTAFQTVTDGSNDGSEANTTTVDLTSQTLQFNGTNDFVAVRFEDLNVPQGATILSASVVFTADRDAAGAANIKIGAEKVDSAPPLSDSLADISLRSVNHTSTTVVWNLEDWTAGNTYATDDISAVLEEVTDQAGWCGGNDLVLFFKNQSGATRNAYSKEGIDANPPADADDPFTIFAPRIKVEYSQSFDASASKCMSNEAVSQISSQAHDFEVESDGDVNNVNSPDLALYYEGSDPQLGVGLIFQNIKVPKDATIKYAYIDFVAKNSTNGAVTTEINIANAGNISNPDTAYLAGEPPSGALIAGPTWNTDDDWVANQGYRTPDLSALISAVVSRADWSLDNSMGFYFKGSAGYHEAHSYSSPGKAPKLRIGFEGEWQPGVNTIRDDLKAAVAGLVPSGGTPISGTMAEAGSYFKGDPVFYGASRNNNRYSRVSHELSYTADGTVIRDSRCTDDNLDSSNCASEVVSGSPSYVSPITESCQTNHIVYLTDGASNSHLGSTNTIYSNWSNGGTCSSSSGGNDCSVKMAAWLHTNDVAPGIPGVQTVTTNMIGFGPGADPVLMKNMAVAGGGGYYSPSDRATLIEDITSIINDITNVNTTFVTSGVTVNQYNRLTHNDQLYFSLFTPQAGVTWPGNIKRYKLSGGDIVDANGDSAINPLNSEFKDEASSFWGGIVDGNDVTRGGTAEQFGKNRSLYTDIGGNNLISTENKVQDSNASITAELLGGVTPLRRTTILDWAEGYDVSDPAYDPADASSLTSTPARKDLGDPLHSQPTVLQYNSPSATTRIYVGTNHGYLHSFDADDGEEKWAYIPQELLSQLDTVVENPNGSKVYGLDGSAAIHLIDGNNNGAVDSGDRALLYIGQRRGGKNYYAVDITNPDSPELLFKIEGGTGDFDKLGQSWSTPTIAKMNLSGVNSDKLVMIFGGGYDEGQDTESVVSRTDTVGNTVFIVDAYDGSLLWSSAANTAAHGGLAGPIATMNSVPSQVTAFDLNEDELIDHMYVTDTKAQVFRFDVDNDTGEIKGGRIAHLNGVALSENRRMYYSPDVALIRQVGDSFISVAIGSGYRAHPLNTEVTDHFFVLKDKGALSGTFDMDASIIDLQDVTSLADADNNGVSDAVELLNDVTGTKKGWYISFDAVGEKVIERSVTFNNAVIFTSYIPPGATGDVCQAAAGGGRVYALNILNGNPYVDTNTDGTLNESDRYAELPGGGIAPPPQVLLEGDGDASSGGVTPRLCIGTKCNFDILPPLSDGLMGIKWRREE
jgi:type IV pilus assembly protein PilY1